jgi:hypothetical protein
VAQIYHLALGSLSVTSYDSQGYCGGILSHLHAGREEGELFVESIVTGDETWFTPESKRHSITWKHPHSSTTKKFKIEPSAKKKTVDLILGL